MESRHDITVGQELPATTETTQIPAVPVVAEPDDQGPSRRSSLAVGAALVAAFVVVTLMGL